MEKTDFCSLKLAKMLFFPSLGNLLTTSSRRERFSMYYQKILSEEFFTYQHFIHRGHAMAYNVWGIPMGFPAAAVNQREM